MEPSHIDTSLVLLQIFVLFFSAKLVGEIFERIKQPAVIGELLVGIIIANSALMTHLQFEKYMDVLDILAEIGVIFLLFTVGLETKLSDLRRVGTTSILVAILGIVIPFGLGYALIIAYSQSHLEAMFIGAAMVATSVGITARVLRDLNVTKTLEAKIILGAAVIDDILGMIVLTIVSASAGEKTLAAYDLIIVISVSILFVIVVMYFGTKVVKKISGEITISGGIKIIDYRRDRLMRLRQKNAPFVVALMVCFGLSALASYFGLAAIIGAFLAGMSFAEVKKRYALEEKMDPITDFLTPFFFVVMGLKVNLSLFANVFLLAIIMTILAIIGKYIGGRIGASRMGKDSASIVGYGMVPRGEVGIIVAMVGLSLHSISEAMFSVVIFMSIVTTLISPPLIVRGFKRKERIKPSKEYIRPRKYKLPPIKYVSPVKSMKLRRKK